MTKKNLSCLNRYIGQEPVSAESKNAQSKADFISKLTIALKEADETQYWLELLYDSDTISIEEFKSLSNDLVVIIGTLIKIIKKTKENVENVKEEKK